MCAAVVVAGGTPAFDGYGRGGALVGGRPPSAAVAAVAAVEMGEVAAALAVKAVTDTNVLVEETKMLKS